MTEAIKLSICIPTYNFGAFIAQTLDSIVPQLAPGVKIVILDGASTDNTPVIVRPYLDRHPQIRYVRQDFRGGIDRDMARTVELARGGYCWLFSSDDIMKPGSVPFILEAIQTGLDIYLVGLTLCDFNMKVICEHPVSGARRGEVFHLGHENERIRYFELAETTTALFSFLGSLIFKRERWNEHELAEDYIGSLWAHVVRIFQMIPNGLVVQYLGDSMSFKRSDNDSFMERGLVHRWAMAIDGYHRIASDIFGDKSIEARHIRRVIVNEFPPKTFVFLLQQSIEAGRSAEIPEINRLVSKVYRDPTWQNVAYALKFRLLSHPFWQEVVWIGKVIVRREPFGQKVVRIGKAIVRRMWRVVNILGSK